MRQTLRYALALGVLQVEGDAALVGVEVQEEAALLDMGLVMGEGAKAPRRVAG